MGIRFSLTIVWFLCQTSVFAQDAGRLLIAAASDLKFALDSLVAVYNQDHPKSEIKVTYGSSGKLYEQITHGAPFDMFFSADIAYPDKLNQQGLITSTVTTYGTGRIVVWSKNFDVSGGIKSLSNPAIRKIAIANPLHAPYGKRAEEALTYYSMLALVQPRLVLGENISQAAQFVTSGAADAGIIALSLAMSPEMKKPGGNFFVIPEKAHQPLKQGFVITKRAAKNSVASKFKEFVTTAKAKDILTYFGFSD
jgi:molybdate transport system substrate-binding protein